MAQAASLKDKRGYLRPILEGVRNRFAVCVAEVDYQDLRQRARVGIVAVSGSVGHLEEVLDSVERWIWSQLGIEVVSVRREWWDPDT